MSKTKSRPLPEQVDCATQPRAFTLILETTISVFQRVNDEIDALLELAQNPNITDESAAHCIWLVGEMRKQITAHGHSQIALMSDINDLKGWGQHSASLNELDYLADNAIGVIEELRAA